MRKGIFSIASAFAVLLFLGSSADIFAQGRGGGRPSGGPPAGAGRPAAAGQPGGGVDRGLGTASTRSGGRSDDGLGNASNRSGGRSDTGLDRARMASSKANSMSDTDLNRYRGLSKRMGTTPEEMRARFETALLGNPDLKFGQFVAAHVVADNLGNRFPNITADNILLGLENGDNFGRTLRNLGMTKEQARDAERLATDRMNEAKNRRP